MKRVAVYSIKGGVGKTASAVNLAYISSLEGGRTLLWDLDPQSSATFYLYFQTRIPYATAVERMGVRRMPVPVFAARSPAALAFAALWREMRAAL